MAGIGYTFGQSSGINMGSSTTDYSLPKTSTQNSGSGFSWSNLATTSIPSLINLGTTAFSTKQQQDLIKQQANAQAQSLDKQLAIEQERTRQAQLGMQNANSGGLVGASGNTMLYVGLGIGAVVILGVVIFSVTRKKSE